eukprot:s508_g25.t1
MSELSVKFAQWLADGEPAIHRADRDLRTPGAFTSVQWNKLVTLVRGQTMNAVADELEAAGRKRVGQTAPAKDVKSWKQVAARNFFLWLPAELQDVITEAGPAMRSGVIDAASAKLLGVSWEPAPVAMASSSSAACWPEDVSQSAPAMSSKWERHKLVNDLVGRILADTQSVEDAQAVLTTLQSRLEKQNPLFRKDLEACKCCERVAPALCAYRETLSGSTLQQFDETVTVRVAKNRRKVRSWGLPISAEKWRKATAKSSGLVKPRGRPSKVNDPEIVKQVVDCIMAHSQESSVWLKSEKCNARMLTSSLLRAYWDSNMVSVVAWKQFHAIVRKHCKWATKLTRRTDYCDYCHLFHTSIEPGMMKLMRSAQKSLVGLMPDYFSKLLQVEGATHLEQLEAMMRYINRHADLQKNAREQALTRKVRQELFQLEAKICHQMSWELQVAKSYHWHWLASQRQSQAMRKELDNLSDNQVLLWSDYKQNLTVPLAHTETGDMFYGTSRMEMTCWGCLIFQKEGSRLMTRNVIILSSIIEHSALVSNLLYLEAAKQIANLTGVSKILVWSDCGPHYKGYDHVAGWIGNWVEAVPPRSVKLSFFAEKHGKGQVDGLFGQVEGWLKNYLKKPGRQISTIDDMESVLRSEAARATKLDATMQYIVVRWEAEHKPPGAWVLPQPEFQISKTYCLHLMPGNPTLRIRNTSLLDRTFSDVDGQKVAKTYPKVELADIADPTWRRGFFSNTRWDRKAPKRGETDAIVSRYEEHQRRKMPTPNLEDDWERAARKQASKLLRRREKWAHMKKATLKEESSSSSSSSSSESSEGSTEAD